MELKSNHLFLSSGAELDNLISPLKKYHINYFTYRKFYTDNSRIFLGTRPDWFETYFSLKYYAQGNTEASPQLYQQQAVLWSTLPNQSIFQAIRDFGVGHGIYLINPHPDFCEFYAFATTPNHPEVVNFYLNNLDVLQNFSVYFKEQAGPLLKKAEQQKICLPYHQQGIEQYRMSDLKGNFKHPHQSASGSLIKELTVSQRQIDCINLLLTGATTKEIAIQLNLSYRTVDDYVNALKQKFHARNKSDLILKLLPYRMKNPHLFSNTHDI